MDFKFDLNDEVSIIASEEYGEVIARAEYSSSVNQYLIRYKAGDGRAVEAWWDESALSMR